MSKKASLNHSAVINSTAPRSTPHNTFVPLTIAIDRELFAAIKALAREQERSISQVTRRLLRQVLMPSTAAP